MDAQMVDRIEIFKGANSLMNGAASSGVGGMINLETKTRGRHPAGESGRRLHPDSQIGTTLDGVALAITTSLARVNLASRRRNRRAERPPPHHAALHRSGLQR
ncbi:MAG: hypothetical protein ACLTXH_00205 [Enterobacter hormaechei]